MNSGLPPRPEDARSARTDLLRPSLVREHDADGAYPYSVRALVLTAFIGGPYALTGLLGLWARRRDRLWRDLPWLGVLSALWTGALVLLAKEIAAPGGALALLGLSGLDVQFAMRHGGRFLALAFVGVFYLRHRHFYRALESLGHTSRAATVPAVICSLLGLVLSNIIVRLFGVKTGFIQ